MNLSEENKQKFHEEVRKLQDLITQELVRLDPHLKLQEDPWERKDFLGEKGGGGITRAFRGNIFENAGVNTSMVYGAADPQFVKTLMGGKEVKNAYLWASGVSLIIHPRNPRVPSVHANFRLIHVKCQLLSSGEAEPLGAEEERYWFGGGADLTPFFPYEEDFEYFHQTWAKACAPYGNYVKMKKHCDEYFVNHHRKGEMRGIGGIFFDHYCTGDWSQDYQMVQHLADHFITSYFPVVEKRMQEKWTKEDEEFQLHRRGRYVEFNLLHDRGTHFGLKTGGRTESILISLPARCQFTYQYAPPQGSPHEKMMEYYWPRDWVPVSGRE